DISRVETGWENCDDPGQKTICAQHHDSGKSGDGALLTNLPSTAHPGLTWMENPEKNQNNNEHQAIACYYRLDTKANQGMRHDPSTYPIATAAAASVVRQRTFFDRQFGA
ncbi:MAG: hypothetical protein LJE64_03940, partial [Desulfofustis sp.]|nr:hypothetical protein [Desulfofustis sp.]